MKPLRIYQFICFCFILHFSVFIAFPQQKNEIDALLLQAENYLKENNKPKAAEYYNKVGFLYWDNNKSSEAISYFSKSLKINEEIQNRHAQIKILNFIGILYSDQEKYNKAFDSYSQALTLSEKSGQKKLIATGHKNIADAHVNLGQYNKAIDNFKKAIEQLDINKDQSLLKTCYFEVANAYKKSGNEEKFYEYYNKYSSVDKYIQKQKDMESSSAMKKMESDIERTLAEKEATEKELIDKTGKLKVVTDSLKEVERIKKQKELENNLLKKEQELKDIKFKEQQAVLQKTQLIQTFLVTGLIVVSLFLIVILRLLSQKRKANNLLDKQYKELYEQKQKIQFQAKQLTETNIELEKMSVIARETDNAISIYDTNNTIEWINRGFSRLFERTIDELIKGNSGVTDSADTLDDKKREHLIGCMDSKQSCVFEYNTKTGSGKSIWVHSTLTPLYDTNGNIHKIISVESDISKSKEAERKIKLQYRIINDSIRYAFRIQRAILPPIDEINTALKHFIIYYPKDVVSGDFYWFSHVKSDGIIKDKIFIAAADCTGHGVPGAMMSMVGVSLLNEIVNAKRIYAPDKILNILDSNINEALNKDVNENIAGMDIGLCLIENASGNKVKVTYSGAKRPMYIYDFEKKEIKKIAGDRKSIGSVKTRRKAQSFTNHEIILSYEDMIYLSSDGWSDQPNPERKKYGSKRLIDFLSRIAEHDLATQQEELENELAGFIQTESQRDDILLIGVSPSLELIKQKSKNTMNWEDKTLLIAEDEEYNFTTIESYLLSSEANIIWAKNGVQAVDHCKNNPLIDAVLMDIKMPEMDGIEAIRKIREFNAEIPIIVQTAYSFSDEKEKSFQAGCNDYITKPIQTKELFATLYKYI